jgi:wobble nucleotide-excising tRNase
MQQAAEASYRSKIKELEANVAETEQKLGELQQHRAASGDKNAQRFILSPEQQAELEKFRQTEANSKKELKELRRNLRAETDSLENRVKGINIALMPAAVTLAGLAIALLKRKSTAAK